MCFFVPTGDLSLNLTIMNTNLHGRSKSLGLTLSAWMGFALALFISVQAASGQATRYSPDDPFLYIKEKRLSELIQKLKERKAIELLLGEGVEARAKQAHSARLYFPRSHPGLLMSGYVDAIKIEYSESGEVAHLEFTGVLNRSVPPQDTPPPAGSPADGPTQMSPRTDRTPGGPAAKQSAVPTIESDHPRSEKQPGKKP